jgi:predicted ATP-grasp superfamily ATP-dependent carboligase
LDGYYGVEFKKRKHNMTNLKSFRKCISDNDNELIIYAADNFPQFPRRTSSVTSKCDRALPAATSNDLVVLRGRLDHEYHNWLRSLNLGSDLVVEYGEDSVGITLSELIINNPEPVKEIIHETGRKPVYVPWYSSNMENEAANVLDAELFGAPESESLKYNDKASFKIICQLLDIPIVDGVSFEINSPNNENYLKMKAIIDEYLQRYDTIIMRGTLGESGMSLYKTNCNDTSEIYQEISDSGEKVIIVEPFLNVSSSPNDQWIISRDRSIHHLGMRDQICKKGMIHTGTINKVEISDANSKYINETSFKIVNKMANTGYKGVVGIDYIVSDKGLFPVENNARFNGSSYVSLIVDNIEKLNAPIPYWKFIKIKTVACSFPVLAERIKQIIYDGEKLNSVFPYNCDALPLTGDFSVVIIAENMNQIFTMEESLMKWGLEVRW